LNVAIGQKRRLNRKTYAPVEPEDVLVQVGLQVVRLDASVVRAVDPRLQVREDDTSERGVTLLPFLLRRHDASFLSGETFCRLGRDVLVRGCVHVRIHPGLMWQETAGF